MAAAAYAFLVSLLNTMDQIQIHSRLSTCFDSFQFQSLREKLDFLVDFVENHSNAFVGEDIDADITQGEALLSRIAFLAQMAEDKIEIEATYRIQGSIRTIVSFFHNLGKIIDGMDSIIKEEVMKMKEEVMKTKEERRFADSQHSSAIAAPPSSSSTAKKTTAVVGFNGYLERVLDELTGYHSGRRILPIVGMGGIGKTTLAITAFEHSLTLYHFDVRVWVTVSQTFSVADIISQALSCLGASTSGALVDDHELGEKVHKLLCGRRYLIVLDDVWSVEAWEMIQFFFPENDNRSRIMVTTRQGEVVDYFGTTALAMDFLDESDSWELFCGKAFAGEGCPPELEEMGRKIVEKCKGLPLAINMMGGLLWKSPRTQQYWEEMAKDRSFVMEKSTEGNKALSILYLSYKYLPVCLKPCFLHLGLFPEDHRIRESFLIKLWVAEGFIKSNTHQSLEQVSKSYIRELVDRNLLLVGDLKLNKKVECYRIHDLVRELCIRIGEKEQFYCVQRDVDGRRQFIVDERSSRFYPRSESLTSSKKPSILKPLILYGKTEVPFKSRLLRILVEDTSDSLSRPFQLLNLRLFLQNHTSTHEVPSSISLCWTLQTIIIDRICSLKLPPEIWKMPQLRHIDVFSLHLPDPPPDDEAFALLNLQTLKTVENLDLSEEMCKRIPNVKELEVRYSLDEQEWRFNYLNKLELLRYENRGGGGLVQGLKLPSSLKELSLWDFHLWESDMAMIASLPHLERLVLNVSRGANTVWDCVEGEFVFVSLKHLWICGWFDLENWVADSSNFPMLETLELSETYNLKEIPSSFGEMPTLEILWVYDCRDTAIESAIDIQQEMESLGNLDFQLTLRFNGRFEAQLWREKVQELGITSQNIHIHSFSAH